MIDVNVIHTKTFSLVPLYSIESVDDISPCVANVRALCECIFSLAAENQKWSEPSEAMLIAGLGAVQQSIEEMCDHYEDINSMSDNDAAEFARVVVEAMAGKLND